MKKILLIDADGIVIKRDGFFSDRFASEQGVPVEKILPFFKNEFKKAVVGDVEMKEVLPAYLNEWGWDGTVDEFLQYWFESENKTDEQVLEFVDRLRETGLVDVYLATDNEKNRLEFIKGEMGLADRFDGIFSSCGFGVEKSEPEFFEKVLGELGEVSPEDVILWDDDEANVETAREAGISAEFYGGFEGFDSAMTEMFEIGDSEGREVGSNK